jgi:methyltransferase
MLDGRYYYFVLLGCFFLRKMADQFRSRRNVLTLAARGTVPTRDRTLGLLWLTHVAFFVLVPLELLLLRRRFVPELGIPMLVLFVMAFLLRWWSTRLLAAHWTSHVAVPLDLEPVTRGPYRWIRHPNYLAMCLELIALSLVYPTYWSAAVVTLLVIVAVIARIRREEESLFLIPAYRAAMERKARLIPGIY